MKLHNAHILVTGGAGGIGLGLVERLMDEGARVTVLDSNRDALTTLQQKQPDVRVIPCDLSRPDEVKTAIESLGEVKLHGLVNNAGILHNAPLVSLGPEGAVPHDVEAWDRVIATDLSSVFYITARVAARMITTRTKGIIVNVSSISANGNAGQSAYAAAKAGVESLTLTWARELGPLGIRVAGIAPGFTDTESTHHVMGERKLKQTVQGVPLRRLGKLSEIVDAMLFILRNDFVHGKTIPVDGGLIL